MPCTPGFSAFNALHAHLYATWPYAAGKPLPLKRYWDSFLHVQVTSAMLALQEWLMRIGRSEEEAAALALGLQSAAGIPGGALVSFAHFALSYSWSALTPLLQVY